MRYRQREMKLRER
jgi:hypothetical protein